MDKVRKDERRNWFYSYDIIFKLDLSSHAKLVYMFLCRCADQDAQSFPSRKTIARNCSISLTSVKTALKELVEIGLLKKEEQFRADGGQTSNLYTIFSEACEADENAHEGCESDVNQVEDNAQGRAEFTPHTSHSAPQPKQNLPTPGSPYVHQEVLPNIWTTSNEVRNNCGLGKEKYGCGEDMIVDTG